VDSTASDVGDEELTVTESADQSHLDLKYFIDNDIYNCPFCNRRHVSYTLSSKVIFNWSAEKHCHVYLVTCASCERVSMHLSFSDLTHYAGHQFLGARNDTGFRDAVDIDAHMFYSVPTSFFVMDDRIPAVIRELITEAEGSHKMNFLTGASACTRKAIYEFLVRENAEGVSYEDKIKSLKSRFTGIDPTLFDVLGHIQDMTSDKVHEQSWPKWDSQHLTLIIETLKTVLHEVYVVPQERATRSGRIQELLQQVRGKKKAPGGKGADPGETRPDKTSS
jgi:hypothetical protein